MPVVRTDIVSVEAQPMGRLVGEERLVGTLGHDLLMGPPDGAELYQSIHGLGLCGRMHLVEGNSGRASIQRRPLGREHDGVYIGGQPFEPSRRRYRPRDVRGVALDLAAGVDQDQVIRADGVRVRDVVEGTPVYPRADDCREGGTVRPGAPKAGGQGRLDQPFAHAGAHRADGLAEGVDRDLRSVAMPLDLTRMFAEAHVIQDRTRIRDNERPPTLSRPPTPSHRESLLNDMVGNGARPQAIVDTVPRSHKIGRHLGEAADGIGRVGSVALPGSVDADARSGPQLVGLVPLLHEEDEALLLREAA